MSTPIPGVLYQRTHPNTNWYAAGRAPLLAAPDPSAKYRPVSVSTLAEARALSGAPSNANYVMWNPAWQHIQQAFEALGSNDILVLPERTEPYLIDSSNGFMAAGVKEVDGVGSDGKKNGSRVPIVSRNNLWFAMARAPRGILGMGPNAIIAPSTSAWRRPAQPILQNQTAGNQTMLRYMLDGSTGEMYGVQEKLIECEHADSFFDNFTLRGRDFGGVGYNGIVNSPPSGGKTHVKRVFFDGCWRGHAGVPNGETGGLALLRAIYDIEACDFHSVGGPSPIMWNRTAGGTVRNVRSDKPNYGMFTYWKCGGVNTLTDVLMDTGQIGFNLEENLAGFELNMTGGRMMLDWPSNNRFHLNINPSGGSIKVRLQGVQVSGNGYTPGTVSAHVYSTAGVQKRSDITSDGLPVAYLSGTAAPGWIA